MASIRKRQWITAKGKRRIAWVVDYLDPLGRRKTKQFATLAEARAWLEQNDLRSVAGAERMTVADAGKAWLERGEVEGLERSTLQGYRRSVEKIIGPYLGHLPLGKLTREHVIAFRKAVSADRSEDTSQRALLTLKMVLNYACDQGWTGNNVAQRMRSAPSARHAKLKRRKSLKIPTLEQARKLLKGCDRKTGGGPPRMRHRTRTFLATLMLSAMRPSEARGLCWCHVNFDKRVFVIEQRMDIFNQMGACKTVASFREVPFGPKLAEVLKQWQAICPASDMGLVFPSQNGTPLSHRNVLREFEKIQRAVGLTEVQSIEGGLEKRNVMFRLYDLRHFRASWWIYERTDLKSLTTWLGHSSVQVTIDIYGHIIYDAEAQAVIATSLEDVLLGDGADPEASFE